MGAEQSDLKVKKATVNTFSKKLESSPEALMLIEHDQAASTPDHDVVHYRAVNSKCATLFATTKEKMLDPTIPCASCRFSAKKQGKKTTRQAWKALRVAMNQSQTFTIKYNWNFQTFDGKTIFTCSVWLTAYRLKDKARGNKHETFYCLALRPISVHEVPEEQEELEVDANAALPEAFGIDDDTTSQSSSGTADTGPSPRSRTDSGIKRKESTPSVPSQMSPTEIISMEEGEAPEIIEMLRMKIMMVEQTSLSRDLQDYLNDLEKAYKSDVESRDQKIVKVRSQLQKTRKMQQEQMKMMEETLNRRLSALEHSKSSQESNSKELKVLKVKVKSLSEGMSVMEKTARSMKKTLTEILEGKGHDQDSDSSLPAPKVEKKDVESSDESSDDESSQADEV